MDAMTSAERLSAAIAGQPVDRLPWSPFLAYFWEAQPEARRNRGQLDFLREVGADPLWRGAPCPVRAIVDGIEISEIKDPTSIRTETRTPVGNLHTRHQLSGPGGTWFLVEHALKTVADFRTRRWIEEHTRFEVDLSPVDQHFAGDGREGLSIGMLLPRGKTAFQSLVETLVGTEELAYALADFPDEVEALYAVMVENDLRAARLAVAGPYRHFITWEDSSTQNYSPAQYRRYIAPEIASLCGILHDQGKHYIQHACGHVKALLPTMLASGVTAVESLSPRPTGNVSLAEARSALGSKVGIIGGIELTEFLRRPLPEFRAYVEQVIADGAGGPFVLANSDSCPPGVAVEKFRLVGDIVRAR